MNTNQVQNVEELKKEFEKEFKVKYARGRLFRDFQGAIWDYILDSECDIYQSDDVVNIFQAALDTVKSHIEEERED